MANGTIALVRTGSGYLTGQLVWSSTSNGTEANTSTVTAQLQIQRSALNATTGTFKGTLTVGSTSETFSWYGTLNSYTWVTVKTMTVTVGHNADGSGTCYLYAIANGPTDTTMEGTYVSGSSTVSLQTIPRYAELISISDFSDEGNPVVTYSNPAGTAVSSLEAALSIDGTAESVAYRSISKTGTSYTFSLSAAERNTLLAATPNSNSLTVYVLLRSSIGTSSVVKKKSAVMSVVNAAPTVAPVITDTNSQTVAVTGDAAILVAGCSVASVKVNAAAQKYAAVRSIRIEHGASVLNGDGTLPVTNHPITVTVTDSRGNTTVYTAPNTIVAYHSPTCLIGNHMPDVSGSYALEASGMFYSGSIGKTTNALTVQYRYKLSGGSYCDWITFSSVSKTQSNYTATAEITGLDYQTAYVFQLRAVDVLSTVVSAEKTVISEPVFDWGKSDFQFHVPVYDQTGGQIGNSLEEWQNPPMSRGVEYRTTARWWGKPVYVIDYYVGYVTKGSNTFTHNLEMSWPLGIRVLNNSREDVTGYSGITSLSADRTAIYMTCTNNFGGIEFILHYIKP